MFALLTNADTIWKRSLSSPAWVQTSRNTKDRSTNWRTIVIGLAGLLRLCSAIKSAEQSPSRSVGRNTLEALRVIQVLTEYGVSLYVKNYNLETLNPDGKVNPVASLICTILLEIASMERLSIKERMASGRDQYIAINPVMAPIIKEVFAQVAEGLEVPISIKRILLPKVSKTSYRAKQKRTLPFFRESPLW